MIQCPQCGAFANRHQGWCAACAAELDGPRPPRRWERLHQEVSPSISDTPPVDDRLDAETEHGPLVRIARFRSAAEAGYFADALRRVEQIPAEVAVDEEREVLHGSWSVRFALLVPASRAEPAAFALKRLIDESNNEDDAQDFADPEPEAASSLPNTALESRDNDLQETLEPAGVNWVPIVITLAVGSAAFITARKVVEAPRAQPVGAPIGARQETLWDHMADDATPWRQTHPNGRGIRELILSPRGDRATLREDADGDGRFEREQVFPLEHARR